MRSSRGGVKADYHIDEYLTFILANNRVGWFSVEDGKTYTGDELITASMGADGLDYRAVWANQRNDTHPPLYYVIIHTLSVLLRQLPFKWIGLIPNILCVAVIDILLYRLCRTLFDDRWAALAAVIGNAVSFTTMGMTAFLRMYSLATVWAVAIAGLFVRYYDRPKDRRYWAGTFLLAWAGTMTHYYFLLYLFFLCLFFGVVLLRARQWKDVALFALSLALAGAASLLTFPGILIHLFFGTGNRGEQARQSMTRLSDWPGNLKAYLDIIDRQVLAETFWSLVLLVLFLVLAAGKKEIWRQCRQWFPKPLAMLCFTWAGYLIAVTKLAPMIEDRYFMPVMWILYVLAAWVMIYGIGSLLRTAVPKRSALAATAVFGAVTCLVLWHNGWELPYSYARQHEQIAAAMEPYKGQDVVCVYDDATWIMIPDLPELKQYRSFSFVSYAGAAAYITQQNLSTMVLCIDDYVDQNALWQEIEGSGRFTNCQWMYQKEGTSFYYLS